MDLFQLEQQRQSLEASLHKLRQSLKVWQTWEAEYEGLKEEVLSIGEQPSADALDGLAKSYDGELVNEKEVRELTGSDPTSPRSAQQIVRTIARRQEYVQKNIETVQRQYFEAEAKSEELAFAARAQSEASDGGLPLTEIHEELDDDGNVISSRLSQPEESTANIISSLRKAGMDSGDLPGLSSTKSRPEELKPAITNASPPITPHALDLERRGHLERPHSRTSSAGTDDMERPSIRKKSVSFSADTKPAEERQRLPSEDGRKSVSFADKVAVMPAAPPPDSRSVSFSPRVEEIPPQPLGPASPDMNPQTTFGALGPSQETSRDVAAAASVPVADHVQPEEVIIPEDESPEDAQTRREMLEYHLHEVGNVVAQIDFEDADMEDDEDAEDDNSSYFTSSEYPDDEDTPYTTGHSESEESEDEFGRTRRRMVSPEYQQQMEQLERRLIGNLGPAPGDEVIGDADPSADPKDVSKLAIRSKRNSTSSASSDNSEKKQAAGKKRVSFAEALDVSEPEPPPPKAAKLEEAENVAPVTSNVMERTTAASHSLPRAHPAPERVSRFAQSRAAAIASPTDADVGSAESAMDEDNNEDISRGPPGVTIANTLTERMPAPSMANAPSIGEPDALMERRELANEYYRRRNDMVKQHGGFLATPDEDDGQGPLMEERDGKVKKVSRFKAARLQPPSS